VNSNIFGEEILLLFSFRVREKEKRERGTRHKAQQAKNNNK
jgi:hypothetical protein